MSTKSTTAPRGLSTGGRRLWRSVTDTYELAVFEQLQLLEACRCADRLDAIAKELEGAPLTTENSKGEERANPLFAEARLQQINLTRLLAALRLPSDDGEGGELARPQRRGGARGAYGARPLHIAGGTS